MQTICSSVIRVSELSAITIEAVKARKANINCKGKMRVVILPKDLCKLLLEYAKGQKITSGPVFVTRTGKPLDRSTIWKMMKALCESAGVDRDKVFPHNLRHTCASLLLANGISMKQIQEWLGHSDFSTTANIYAHLEYDTKLQSAEMMAKVIG